MTCAGCFQTEGCVKVYLEDGKQWSLEQSRSGTNDMENSNPMIRDCNQTLGRDAGVKRTTFSLKAKSNSSGNKDVHLGELLQSLLNKREF